MAVHNCIECGEYCDCDGYEDCDGCSGCAEDELDYDSDRDAGDENDYDDDSWAV